MADVFDFAYDKWVKEHDVPAADQIFVKKFLGFAKDTFRKNQPIAHEFLSDTLSLRFQDGTSLDFCTPKLPEENNDGTISATGGQIPPTQTWDLTGKS